MISVLRLLQKIIHESSETPYKNPLIRTSLSKNHTWKPLIRNILPTFTKSLCSFNSLYPTSNSPTLIPWASLRYPIPAAFLFQYHIWKVTRLLLWFFLEFWRHFLPMVLMDCYFPLPQVSLLWFPNLAVSWFFPLLLEKFLYCAIWY